ncbi:solute carrier organic anion transporter family member 2A1-like [Saccoglossus kowalevskii]
MTTKTNSKNGANNNYQKSFVQRLLNPRIFMIQLSVSLFLVACMAMGYMAGVLPTIQKRYHLSDAQTDWIGVSYGVGVVFAILWISHFGSYGRRPIVMAFGILVCAVGGVIAALPHFVLPRLQENAAWNVLSNRSTEKEYCGLTHDVNKPDDFCDEGQLVDAVAQDTTTILVSVGLLLCGFGVSPLLSLGTVYMDDGVGSHETAIYLGVVSASLILGPCIGFVTGVAIVMTYHIEFNYVETTMTSTHPYWLGAWWMGFLIFSGIMVVSSVPFFFCPKEFSKSGGRRGRYKWGFNFGEKLKTLMCNPLLMAVCIGAGAEMAVNIGVMMHLPHYLETQMQASELYASTLSVAIMLPMACLGIFTGGLLIKKLQLSAKKCARVIMYADLTTILIYLFIFLFGCSTQIYPDVFHSTPNSSSTVLDNNTNITTVNLTMPCNVQCNCDMATFYPVCGSDDVTYYSPCHAGCLVKEFDIANGANGQPVKKYSNCSCVAGNMDEGTDNYVIGGVCDTSCANFLPFTLTMFAIASFFSNMPWIPSIMIVLRTMNYGDRSISIGLQYLFMHLFGFILVPLILLAVVESTCFLRHMVCGESGMCMAYDILSYRYAFLTVAGVLKFIAFCAFRATAAYIRKLYKKKGRKRAVMTPAKTMENHDEMTEVDKGIEWDIVEEPKGEHLTKFMVTKVDTPKADEKNNHAQNDNEHKDIDNTGPTAGNGAELNNVHVSSL